MKSLFRKEFEGLLFEIVSSLGNYHLYIDGDWIHQFDLADQYKIPRHQLVEELVGKELNDQIYDYFEYEFYIENNGYSNLNQDLRQYYNEFVVRKIYQRFMFLWSDIRYEYHDNYRFAQEDNLEQVNRYKRIQGQGCCGYYDEVIPIDGVNYLIGFNYGH